MTHFEYLSVVLSFVAGLAVAIVLTSAVRAFRSRRRTQMDWIPFVWAACILLIQFQTWWVMFTFRSKTDWTFGDFGILTLQMLLLFVASALVLPDDSVDYPESLGDYFDRDGRWCVAAMALQIVMAVVANTVVMGSPFWAPFHLFHLTLIATCMVLLTSTRRAVTVGATVVFGAGTLAAMVATALGSIGP